VLKGNPTLIELLFMGGYEILDDMGRHCSRTGLLSSPSRTSGPATTATPRRNCGNIKTAPTPRTRCPDTACASRGRPSRS
jgi:hypothetical protein